MIMKVIAQQRNLKIFFVAIILLFANYINAAESNVELEWEVLPNARKYDLEVKASKKTFTFTVQNHLWQGRLTPGIFQMRVRGRDKRNVPGPWSSYEQFKVHLDPVEIYNPVANAKVQSSKEDIEKISIKWKSTPFAKKYNLEIVSIDNPSFRKTIETTKLTETISLPVAQRYKFSVKAINDYVDSHPIKTKEVEFSIIGTKLDAPEITAIESLYVRDLKWSKSELATEYSYKIEKYDLKQKKYTLISEGQTKSNNLPFKKEWPGGNYRFSVKSLAYMRLDSDIVSSRFAVIDGDRSVVTEELATLRESIDRLSGWYATGSYLVTSVDYLSHNPGKNNVDTTFNAIGGTAKVGIGYMTKKKAWGYFSSFETSVVEVEGFNSIRYNAIDFNGVHKFRPNTAGEIRQTLGILYKELPDISNNQAKTQAISEPLSALGIRYGIEYWHAVNSKVGLQVNAQLLPTLYGIKTTNSKALVPSLSYQAGVLGSYRFNKSLTGLVGYAYRLDTMSYKSSANTSTGFNGDDPNRVDIKGHYLNLLVEYQL